MRRTLVCSLLVVALSTIAPAAAFADIATWGVFNHSGSNPFGNPAGEQAVNFTAGDTGTLIGSLHVINGVTSSTHNTVSISTSANDQLYASAATLVLANPPSSSDTSLNQLTISIPRFTFTDSYMDLVGAFSGTTSATFMVTMSDGTTFTHVYNDMTSGDNWVFFETVNGEKIASISIDSRWSQLYDLHVSNVAFVPTPEPASIALFGAGLLFLVRRKRR